PVHAGLLPGALGLWLLPERWIGVLGRPRRRRERCTGTARRPARSDRQERRGAASRGARRRLRSRHDRDQPGPAGRRRLRRGGRRGMGSLAAIDEVTMVVMPDIMTLAVDGDGAQVRDLQGKMISHCEIAGDRMAILDAPPDLLPQDVLEWRTSTAGYDSKMAA